jgi:hypothetical protein
MNKFYHELAVGWNWWYVAVPIAAILMFLVGYQALYVRSGLARQRYNARLPCLIAGALTGVLTTLIFCESGMGILQLMLNQLEPQESPIWAFMVGGVLTVAGIGCLYVGLICLSDLGRKWHRHNLQRQGIKFAPKRTPRRRQPRP